MNKVATSNQNFKVKITAYKDRLIIEAIDPENPHDRWTPNGPGKIGSVIGDTKTNLGISNQAYALLKRIRRSRDDIGDIDWFACDDGTYAFAWLGSFKKIVDPKEAEGSRTYVAPEGQYVKIKNIVPKEAKKVIDEIDSNTRMNTE